MKAIWIALLGVALLAGSATGASTGGSIDLVAYSTPKDAYGKVISAFQGTQAGNGVNVSQSYGASSQIRSASAGGAPVWSNSTNRSPQPSSAVKRLSLIHI